MNEKIEETLNKAKEYAEIAYKKTGEAVNLGKQKIELASLNNKLDKAYQDFGKAIFDGTAVYEGNAGEAAGLIRELQVKISELETIISESKNKKVCPECGKKMADDAAFCPYCGKQM